MALLSTDAIILQVFRYGDTSKSLRLLTRTTRSVSPTEAGERLLHPALAAFREKVRAFLAEHDPLTGLANRRRFDLELERHVDDCRRYGARGAVLMLDLDHFKDVNDTLGHEAGDHLLQQVAARLRACCRDRGDQVGPAKDALDPDGLLNPGVKVPRHVQAALGNIKYEPDAEALPPRAMAALRLVERQRLYARSRLELLDEVAGERAGTPGNGDANPAADGLPAPTPAS